MTENGTTKTTGPCSCGKSPDKSFEGYLGMILGAAAAALLDLGNAREDIHDMLDMAFRARESGSDARMAEAVKIIGDVAKDLA